METVDSTLKEKINDNILVKRFTSETPDFWKKVRNVAGIIAGIGTACASFPLLPPTWRLIAGFIAGIAGAIAGTAQLTTTDKKISENKKEILK